MLTAMRISGLCAACALFSAASGLGAPLAGAQTAPIGALSQPASKTEASSRIGDAEIVRDLRSEMNQLAAEDRFSGVVLLSKDGQPLFEHAYGFADHAFSAPNKVDTKFNMASASMCQNPGVHAPHIETHDVPKRNCSYLTVSESQP